MSMTVAGSYSLTVATRGATVGVSSSDANGPIDWLPTRYEDPKPTALARPSQDVAWASLAARARASWARENPA